jgi:hypothetical protein
MHISMMKKLVELDRFEKSELLHYRIVNKKNSKFVLKNSCKGNPYVKILSTTIIIK